MVSRSRSVPKSSQLQPPANKPKASSVQPQSNGAVASMSASREPSPPTRLVRKRTASQSSHGDQEGPSDASIVSADDTDLSQGSTKRARTDGTKRQKEDKPKQVPSRASKRKATKASTKASVAKATAASTKSDSQPGSQTLNASQPKVKRPAPPSLNPLPGVPPRVRPPRELFVFGTGEMGQFGLGADPSTSTEIKRPRLHAWVNTGIAEGKFGEVGAGIETAAAGGMHNLMIDETGRIWSWGVNDGAALGRKTSGIVDPETNEPQDNAVLESTPMLIQSLVDQKFRAIDVVAGDSVSIAISDTGELRAWGSFRSRDGILGFDGRPNSSKLQFEPMSLPTLKSYKFVQAACGENHAIALTTQGYVFAWGDGREGALGRRVLERHILHGLDPDRLALRNVVHVASGQAHSFAVDSDGLVYGWGTNKMGQVGVAMADDDDDAILESMEDLIAAPTVVEALRPENLGDGRKVVQISGGEHHTLFLLNDGSVFACGRCDNFQLGLALDNPPMARVVARKAAAPETALECIPIPTQIHFPPPPTEDDNDPPLGQYVAESPLRTKIVHVSAGTRHNLAVSEDGVVYGWGYGNQSQLGMGDKEEQVVPARVKSKAMAGWKFEKALAGGQHCLLVGRKEE